MHLSRARRIVSPSATRASAWAYKSALTNGTSAADLPGEARKRSRAACAASALSSAPDGQMKSGPSCSRAFCPTMLPSTARRIEGLSARKTRSCRLCSSQSFRGHWRRNCRSDFVSKRALLIRSILHFPGSLWRTQTGRACWTAELILRFLIFPLAINYRARFQLPPT